MSSLSEKQWILLSHLGTFIGYVVPLGNVILPLVIYSIKKEEPLVKEHSRNSLNFQISFSLYFFVSLLFLFLFIGIPFLVILPML